jgi:hypothetical protein
VNNWSNKVCTKLEGHFPPHQSMSEVFQNISSVVGEHLQIIINENENKRREN